MNLTQEQIQRYSRHILLKNVGGKGQETLLNSKVLIVGMGGLGSPVALYLAAAGVGTLGLADFDRVDLSNLQRQIAHHSSDVGRPKVDSAQEKIEAINPDIRVIRHSSRLNQDTIREIVRQYDFVIEGTDNFPSKYLVNDACVFEGVPFNQGGILRFQGQTMTWRPGSACYRCVFPSPPPAGAVPTCSEAGVLGAVAGILGTIQATEALKFLLGIGELLTNRVLYYDALSMNFRVLPVSPNENCRIDGKNPDIIEVIELEQSACSIEDRYVDTKGNRSMSLTITKESANKASPEGAPQGNVSEVPKVCISMALYNQIRDLSRKGLPNEICGYLSSKNSAQSQGNFRSEIDVTEIHSLTNIDASPEHYSFDPKEQFETFQKVTEEGKKLIGTFHSHPSTAARMSEEDIRLATDEKMIYGIYSVSEDELNFFTVSKSGEKKVHKLITELV